LIRLATANDRARWNGYVDQHPHASVYHRWEWLDVFERVYGVRARPLLAYYDGRVTGVLPLVELVAPMLGRRLVSLPYFGHGGALADDDPTWRCLLDAAAALRAESGARHVELRHAHPVPAEAMPTRGGKVLMRVDLSAGEEAFFKALGPKVRADVRRPEKEGMTSHVGGAELMRDLGSPCHALALFEEAMRAMPERTFVVVVRYQGLAVGGGFLAGHGPTLEIPCAGSMHRLARLRGNMLLYGAVLREAMRRGYKTFSFGRSSEDSGTFTFKKNWGAVATPLPYHYLLPPGATLPAAGGDDPLLQRVSETWKRLPVALTARVGPRLVRLLP
jgi:FemAB-related protein (PEP-CTERM system-associated)